MTHIHKLSTETHFEFLNEHRKDPITGDLIKENDEVVICSSCKSVFLKESWEYLGKEHCNQNETLVVIPKQSKLSLKKAGLVNFLPLTPIENILSKFSLVAIIEIILISLFYSLLQDSLMLLLVLGAIIVLLPVAIGILITPTTQVELHSSYLLIKKAVGKTKINYADIQYIIIQCYETDNVARRIHIKYKHRGTYDILLNESLTNFHDDKLLGFVTVLSRYTRIKIKINNYHDKQKVIEKNLDIVVSD
ncbi:hypothetical protein [Bernardetia sp.]|uniref:hypothetical protein n=1 Tax=Bernardetia sp. TaxID=1937974 RepID=UPI0025BAF3B4|nr:hypothetical protein [Bernardetia sp.]